MIQLESKEFEQFHCTLAQVYDIRFLEQGNDQIESKGFWTKGWKTLTLYISQYSWENSSFFIHHSSINYFLTSIISSSLRFFFILSKSYYLSYLYTMNNYNSDSTSYASPLHYPSEPECEYDDDDWNRIGLGLKWRNVATCIFFFWAL